MGKMDIHKEIVARMTDDSLDSINIINIMFGGTHTFIDLRLCKMAQCDNKMYPGTLNLVYMVI